MINLSTPTDIMMRELMADKAKTLYWLKKKMGGDKKYEQMRDELLRSAMRDKCNKISDVVELRSANGNRWMTYECARYYPEAGTAYSEPLALCFYETLGSVGAFLPIKVGCSQDSGEDAILVFNSHFFHQMCERLNVGFRTPQMVRRFHEIIPSLLMEQYEDRGRQRLLVRLPGSIGFGFKMSGDALVYEIRTFLKDVQLNNKQKKQTATIRAHADKFAYEPGEVTEYRLKEKIKKGESLDGDWEAIKEKFELLGVPKEKLDTLYIVNVAILNAFSKMGYTDPYDYEFCKRHNQVNKDILCEYVMTIDQDDERFYTLLEQCAKNLDFRRFTIEKAKQALQSLVQQ